MGMQSVLRAIYPAQCIGCGTVVLDEAALCPACWRETPFIRGSACVKCGAPLPGEAPGDEAAECDDCMATPRPWETGAAALVYEGVARRLVMALKHGDRHDLVRPFAGWMAARLRCAHDARTLIVPVPIHWRRLLRRRFNQSALLARSLARQTGAVHAPDALHRIRNTAPQEGMTVEERTALQTGAIVPHPRRGHILKGRHVLIVDDVMTSGATLSAAASAARSAGARRVDTLTLARVVKDF
jgi:ComF family protein